MLGESDQRMMRCLHPQNSHLNSGTPYQVVCSTCGFLLSGAVLDHWQVLAFVRQSEGADLYLASDTTSTIGKPARALVKVFRALPANAHMYLERLRTLRHSHIQPLLAVGSIHQQQPYTIVPYEERGSLARYLKGDVHLPLAFVSAILAQIADALYYIHQRQYIYGHLKPENCLLTAPMTVQITDLHYALFPRTPAEHAPFIAPEQRQGNLKHSSDQYALAVLAYVLLSGGLNPSGDGLSGSDGTFSLAGQTAVDRPRSLRSLRNDLSPEVDQILQRALRPQPADRFPTILSFATALQAALARDPRLSFSSVPVSASSPEHPPVPRLPLPPPSFSPSGSERVARSDTSLSLVQQHHSEPRVHQKGKTLPEKFTLVCHLPGHTSEVTTLHWGNNGLFLASAGSDNSLCLWRVHHRIGAPLASLTGLRGKIVTLRWARAASILASGATDSTVRLWHVANEAGKALKPMNSWLGHEGQINALDWAADDATIATGGVDRMIRLWQVSGKMQRAWQAHKRGVTALAWSAASGLLASGGADRQLYLWDANRGQKVHVCEERHQDEIKSLFWSPDGRFLVSIAGKKDTTICLWDGLRGNHLATLTGHTREVVGIFWSADASWFASAAADGSLCIWNALAPSQTPVVRMALPGMPLAMAGDLGQNLLAIGFADMQLLVIHLE